MTSVSKDIEWEAPSGWMWRITVSATFCVAEPDVGIMRAWIDDARLAWTKTGKELSADAYSRIPDDLMERIYDELHQAHSDNF